jgi:hypothetical protein
MTRNPDVAGILAQHGLVPGPEGFVLTELEAVIAAHGWRADVDEREPSRSGYHRTPQFGAVVFTRTSVGGGFRQVRGRGDTATAALAQALAKLLS